MTVPRDTRVPRSTLTPVTVPATCALSSTTCAGSRFPERVTVFPIVPVSAVAMSCGERTTVAARALSAREVSDFLQPDVASDRTARSRIDLSMVLVCGFIVSPAGRERDLRVRLQSGNQRPPERGSSEPEAAPAGNRRLRAGSRGPDRISAPSGRIRAAPAELFAAALRSRRGHAVALRELARNRAELSRAAVPVAVAPDRALSAPVRPLISYGSR